MEKGRSEKVELTYNIDSSAENVDQVCGIEIDAKSQDDAWLELLGQVLELVIPPTTD